MDPVVEERAFLRLAILFAVDEGDRARTERHRARLRSLEKQTKAGDK